MLKRKELFLISFPENSPPSLDSSTQFVKTIGEALSIILEASDPDGNDVTMATNHNDAQIINGNQLHYNGEWCVTNSIYIYFGGWTSYLYKGERKCL